MPSYTVKDATVKKPPFDWNGKQKTVYLLTLENGDGKTQAGIEWFTDASDQLPRTGWKLDGTVEPGDGQYAPKFKKERKGAGKGFGGKSLQEQRRIAAQASANTATTVVDLALRAGAFNPDSVAQTTDAVLAVAKKLYDRVEEVGS